MDKMLRISSSFKASANFLVSSNILAGIPDCEKCGLKMDLHNKSSQSKGYVCKTCFTKTNYRHSSFLAKSSMAIQEFVRIAFYYFLKNYEPDLAHREMTENSSDGIGVGTGRSSVFAVYALCRERISRHQLYTTGEKKLGGPGSEVVVDFMKLHLRNKNTNKNDEWLVLGFMEREGLAGGRCRAYIIPSIKVQTVAQYMAKTIAKGTTVFTPFY